MAILAQISSNKLMPLTPMEEDNEIKMPYDFTERENGRDDPEDEDLEEETI